MRSRQLTDTLSGYVEAAAAHLRSELSAGAEVPFELDARLTRRSGGAAPLYCYRALTGEFIDEREAELRALEPHARAAELLEHFDGLDHYVRAHAGPAGAPRQGEPAARARFALRALLHDVFEEQTDFELRPQRLRAALDRLQDAAVAGPSDLTVLTTLHAMTISAQEVALGDGLCIARCGAVQGAPPAAITAGGPESVLVVYSAQTSEAHAGIAQARERLGTLLLALRLFGDGRVALGELGWARIGAGSWSPIALGSAGRPHGMLILTGEQEQELRSFLALVTRRAPKMDEVAWALRRYELGCQRASAQEALSDYLLALRALLEPEGSSSATLPSRLAALCAKPEARAQLAERVADAAALERAIITGEPIAAQLAGALADELCSHLRALLSDVICGHLDPNLVTLADELLLAQASAGEHAPEDATSLQKAPAARKAPAAKRSGGPKRPARAAKREGDRAAKRASGQLARAAAR